MIKGDLSDGIGLGAAGGKAETQERSRRVSVRFRRGPVVAIISAALLWAGLIAAWRLL